MKKIISVVLAAALSAALFTACGAERKAEKAERLRLA